MSYEERKLIRQRKKKIRNIVFLILLLSIIGRTAYGIFVKNPKTILPEEDQYIVSTVVQSVLIKDEKLYELDGDFLVNSNVEEGKRIPQGFEIGKVNIVKNISSLNEELEEINKTIEVLSNKNQEREILTKDKDNFELTQEALIEEIQRKINDKDYSDIAKLKKQIVDTDIKIGELSMDNTLLANSIENLEARRDTIVGEISNNSNKHYSQKSGIISFMIDGFENIYIPQEFENYTYDRIEIPNEGLEMKEDKPINKYKIIDNFDWYLAIKVDNIKGMDKYEVNNSILLKIENSDRELRGRIIAINTTGNKAVYIVAFSSYLHEYYDLRFPRVEIILDRQEIYLIPTKAIFDKEGQKGVYIKEFNGIVRFRPVEIVNSAGDQTMVSKGDENRFINTEEDKPIRTISLYDEILLNPNHFIEGEILN